MSLCMFDTLMAGICEGRAMHRLQANCVLPPCLAVLAWCESGGATWKTVFNVSNQFYVRLAHLHLPCSP